MPRITRTPDSVIGAATWMIELMGLVKAHKIAFIQKGDITQAMDARHEDKTPEEAFKTIFGHRAV